MEQLDGKVTLVTGGGRGLGEAICRELAMAGAVVIPADIQVDLAEKVAQDLYPGPHSTYGICVDVSDAAQVSGVVEKIRADFGRLDILINNAGTDKTLSIEEISIEDWERVIDVNLRGPFLTAKAVFPIMREQGGGHIVNITSTASKRAWANASAYHASKWGLLGLSHAMHVEGRPHHIKVTALVAGGMRTPFLLDRFPDINLDTLQDPANVAKTIHFVLTQPDETVIPEVMVLPVGETSWP